MRPGLVIHELDGIQVAHLATARVYATRACLLMIIHEIGYLPFQQDDANLTLNRAMRIMTLSYRLGHQRQG